MKNINVYQLWDAIGDVDEQLIIEIEKYYEIRQRKQKKLIWGLSAVACVMLCVLSFHIINSTKMIQGNNEPRIDGNVYGISKENGKSDAHMDIASISEPSIQPTENEKVEINKGYHYFNAKYGGNIKQVTEKLWSENFDTDIFNCDSGTKYFLSYSKENEVLYGVLELKTKTGGLVSVRVGKNVMIDSGYSKLRKTEINGVEIAICSIGDSDTDNKTQYAAIYRKSHIVYTIEWGDDLSELMAALKEAIQPEN